MSMTLDENESPQYRCCLRCNRCEKDRTLRLLKCSKCRCATYCSVQCQKNRLAKAQNDMRLPNCLPGNLQSPLPSKPTSKPTPLLGTPATYSTETIDRMVDALERYHAGTLIYAIRHALQVSDTNLGKLNTHILDLRFEICPSADGNPAKILNLVSARAVTPVAYRESVDPKTAFGLVRAERERREVPQEDQLGIAIVSIKVAGVNHLRSLVMFKPCAAPRVWKSDFEDHVRLRCRYGMFQEQDGRGGYRWCEMRKTEGKWRTYRFSLLESDKLRLEKKIPVREWEVMNRNCFS